MDREAFIAANRNLAAGSVIDLGPFLRAQRTDAQAIDLIEAWERRKVQLLEEANAVGTEVIAAAERLSAVMADFSGVQSSAITRLEAIRAQVTDIDTAIAHLRGAAGRALGDG